jgi:CRP/FNR family cyclic AMP-dependent transcriptional regulator
LNERLPTPLPDTGPLIEALAKVPLFEGVDRAELAALADRAIERNYARNFIVVHEGDRADALYVVLAGRVKVFIAGEDGRDVVLTMLGAGNYFGEMMLDDGVRSASVMTLERCRLATLSRHEFEHFLMHHPASSLALFKNQSRRTRSMNERLRDMSILDVSERALKLLWTWAHEVDGRWLVEHRPTHQEIGEQVGACREMVSRVFTALKADSSIREEGRRVILLRKPRRA